MFDPKDVSKNATDEALAEGFFYGSIAAERNQQISYLATMHVQDLLPTASFDQDTAELVSMMTLAIASACFASDCR